MTARAKSWASLSLASAALIAGAVAAVPVLADRTGFDLAHWTRASLIDPVLCVFVPYGAPSAFYTEIGNAHARMHRAMEGRRSDWESRP